MTAALKLKNIPNVLCYAFSSDTATAGDVAVSRTKQELLDDCQATQLLAHKQLLEKAVTPEAWAALNSKFECVAISGRYARVALTAKFSNDDGLVFAVAGKSAGISIASVEVRLKP